jgi:hypothetical protein
MRKHFSTVRSLLVKVTPAVPAVVENWPPCGTCTAVRRAASRDFIRAAPGAELRKHEVFAVAEEVVKTIDGVDVTFFKIKGHDHGWLFDRTPKAPNKVLVQRVQC